MASVAFDHVDKVYPNGTRALAECTLEIADGELLVCVGPSGCGKSTLLRLVAGLEGVTNGVIRIGERAVNDLPPQQRNVAMVFQDYALYPFMTVRRNLEFPLKMRSMRHEEMQRRVGWAAELLDIAPLLDRLPKQLSGGQRQRVAMGRALVREPAVSLLDEPLSNLDAKLRVQVRAEIGELQRRTNTTMIYVTHDQVEAMTLGHRVAVLRDGRLQQIAPPRELYDNPANVFVAGFIGNPPMNVFPARVSRDASGPVCVTFAQHTIPLPENASGVTAGVRYTAGIRPEALHLAPNESGVGRLRAVVEHIEQLGHETLAHVVVGERKESDDAVRLIARFEGMHELGRGQPISLQVDAARIYLFDDTGVVWRGASE